MVNRLFFQGRLIRGLAILAMTCLSASCMNGSEETTSEDYDPTALVIEESEPTEETGQSGVVGEQDLSQNEEIQGIQRIFSSLAGSRFTARSNRQFEVTQENQIALPEVNPLLLKGKVAISSSASVFPITKSLVDRFLEEGYPGQIELASIVTSQAFELFCRDGTVDFVNSGRPIREEEIAACRRIGREPIGFQIGRDAIAIVVSRRNDFLPEDLTKEEIVSLFTSQRWSDVNPLWSNELIQRSIPRQTNRGGNFDLFVEKILDGENERLLNARNTTTYSAESDLVTESLSNPNLLGFLSSIYVKRAPDAIRAIAIDGTGAGPKASYPLIHSLFIYTDANIIRERSEVEAFLNYYLTFVNEEIFNAGAFPVKKEVLDAEKIKFIQLLGYQDLLDAIEAESDFP